MFRARLTNTVHLAATAGASLVRSIDDHRAKCGGSAPGLRARREARDLVLACSAGLAASCNAAAQQGSVPGARGLVAGA